MPAASLSSFRHFLLCISLCFPCSLPNDAKWPCRWKRLRSGAAAFEGATKVTLAPSGVECWYHAALSSSIKCKTWQGGVNNIATHTLLEGVGSLFFITWFLLSASCCLFAGQQAAENFTCSWNTCACVCEFVHVSVCVTVFFYLLYPLSLYPLCEMLNRKPNAEYKATKDDELLVKMPKYSRKECKLKGI